MPTEKQLAANRLNARNSTGPRTEHGKRRSRRNAFRHGLTAETVINVLEDQADYEALAAAINADYRPRTNFELELIARLVSLLWRLRRAVAIESGLLSIHATVLCERKDPATRDELDVFYRLIRPLAAEAQTGGNQQRPDLDDTRKPNRTAEPAANPDVTHTRIARSFLRLASVDGRDFERLGRYETNLWRQTVQIILLLNSVNRGENDEAADYYSGRYLRLKNVPRRSRRILWPPFVPFA
jgi:hypothetical protein